VTPATKASDDLPQIHVAKWGLVELVESATRSGNIELAQGALKRLGAHTNAAGTNWALGIQARSEALLSQGESAERSYHVAIERLGSTTLRPDLARAHLLYGEWLRRERRRVDARAQLRAAYELFVEIGMEAFAHRARSELLATGAKVRKRTSEARNDLTPQEHHIAQLARDGLSNPEIAARLYLSARTVEWHLHKVFTKLGVRSRRELAGVLASPRSMTSSG
jgi:DNA-binding CsgD family transcriptional regulator